MFYEWLVAGVAFGIKAVVAVIVFLLCSAAIAGVLALISSAFGGNSDGAD